MEHTPGPWFASRDDGNEGNYVSVEDRVIADTYGYFCDTGLELPEEEAEANARLIATAPELLEAVQDLVDRLEIALEDVFGPEPHKWDKTDNDARTMAYAAIAKATGK